MLTTELLNNRLNNSIKNKEINNLYENYNRNKPIESDINLSNAFLKLYINKLEQLLKLNSNLEKYDIIDTLLDVNNKMLLFLDINDENYLYNIEFYNYLNYQLFEYNLSKNNKIIKDLIILLRNYNIS